MVFCGIPIFFQEVAIGQYLGAGGMTLVGQLCPLLQGYSQIKNTSFFLSFFFGFYNLREINRANN